MVVKIQPPAASVSRAVEYNEQKVSEGKAEVTFCSNIEDHANAMKTFAIYERANIRTTLPSFHVSVNPSTKDMEKMTEEKMTEFIRDWMSEMGYGNQPYIVYRHNDIDRPHYHIVSIRVDSEGKKIDDSFERKRCRQSLDRLSVKYGFEIGNGQREGEKQTPNPYQGFNPQNGDVSGQIEEIVKLAMKYHFTTVNQFACVLNSFNVKVSFEARSDGQTEMKFAGMEPRSKEPCTVQISEKDLKVPSYRDVESRAAKSTRSIKTREKKRVDNLAETCFKYARSESHFVRMMHKKQIDVHFSKTEKGEIFGVTFVDHRTKCCFKASELEHISAEKLEAQRNLIWEAPTRNTNIPEAENKAELLFEAAIEAMAQREQTRNADAKIMREARKRKRTIYG